MTLRYFLGILILASLLPPIVSAVENDNDAVKKDTVDKDVVFCIGEPDGFCSEFAITQEGYAAFKNKFPNGVTYTVGNSTPKKDWAFVHPSTKDDWAGNKNYPFIIKFNLPDWSKTSSESTTLVIGYVGSMFDPEVSVNVNGNDLPTQKVKNTINNNVVFNTRRKGAYESLLFTVPNSLLKTGENI
ncbi:MAG: hypothetical protein LBE12_03770, partial [Planctomycetaceae bacterium]|nr:hypothetical protein [Planctomycetaceae bacterium]